MKIINMELNQYGQDDYDNSYLNWGFEKLEYQLVLANKLAKMFPENAKTILDLACGIGRYHSVWLSAGYSVYGIDISKTFIKQCKINNADFPNASYAVCSFNDMDYNNKFDVVTWADPILLTGKPVHAIYKSLKSGGVFIYEMRNENYHKYRSDTRHVDGQTWSCNNKVYTLIKHNYNKATSTIEHEEIIFDVPNDTMIRKTNLGGKPVNHHCSIQILEASGFKDIRFIDIDNNPFDPANDKIKQFFMIGTK